MKRLVWQLLLIVSFVVLLVGLLTSPYYSYSGYVALLGFGMLIVFAFRSYEKPETIPVFSTSISSSLVLFLFFAGFFILLAVGELHSNSVDYTVVGIYLLLTVSLLYGCVRLWRLPVRKVELYDDYFEVSGRGGKALVRYADLTDVSKESGFSLWLPWTRIRVRLRNQEELSIPGNPTLRKSKTNLYTWLLGKTKRD